jgi:hypothetical protein
MSKQLPDPSFLKKKALEIADQLDSFCIIEGSVTRLEVYEKIARVMQKAIRDEWGD